MGSRQLRRWLHRPLRDHALLRRRHQCLGQLLENRRFEDVHGVLRGIADIERILARVALKSARPRDLAALRDSLGQLPALQETLAGNSDPLLGELAERIGLHPAVHVV